MNKKKIATAITTGALLLSSLTPMAFADTTVSASTNSVSSPVTSLVSTVNGVVQNVVSNLGGILGGIGLNSGNVSANISNQTGLSVLGNSAQTSTDAGAKLSL